MNIQAMNELFGGAERYRALRYLFQNPAKDFGVRELATEAGIDPGNASRWMRRWAELGLLSTVEIRGRTRYAASHDPELAHLRKLFQQDSKTVASLRARVEELGDRVAAAALFGSAAHGTTHADSDLDLLLITDMHRLESQVFFKPVGRDLGRTVNTLVYTSEDWQQAVDQQDTLATDILGGEFITLKGKVYGSEEAK